MKTISINARVRDLVRRLRAGEQITFVNTLTGKSFSVDWDKAFGGTLARESAEMKGGGTIPMSLRKLRTWLNDSIRNRVLQEIDR